MTLLAILNTIMTAGILIGVWWSVLKPNGSLAAVLGKIKSLLDRLAARDGGEGGEKTPPAAA